MKVRDHAAQLLSYLHTQPGNVASKQDIITTMAKMGVSNSASLETLLRDMVTSGAIVHSTVIISGTKVHRYTAV